jgi:hypothetical protein
MLEVNNTSNILEIKNDLRVVCAVATRNNEIKYIIT